MTIEIFYLTAQMQRWLNLQVARHLEAQAAKLKPEGTVLTAYPTTKLGADGPGGSVGLDRMGMPDGCYLVDEAESVDTVPAAVCARQCAAQSATRDSETQAVRA
jgi:hypothetical protein